MEFAIVTQKRQNSSLLCGLSHMLKRGRMWLRFPASNLWLIPPFFCHCFSTVGGRPGQSPRESSNRRTNCPSVVNRMYVRRMYLGGGNLRPSSGGRDRQIPPSLPPIWAKFLFPFRRCFQPAVSGRKTNVREAGKPI